MTNLDSFDALLDRISLPSFVPQNALVGQVVRFTHDNGDFMVRILVSIREYDATVVFCYWWWNSESEEEGRWGLNEWDWGDIYNCIFAMTGSCSDGPCFRKLDITNLCSFQAIKDSQLWDDFKGERKLLKKVLIESCDNNGLFDVGAVFLSGSLYEKLLLAVEKSVQRHGVKQW